jgi:hypothetical protein
MEVENTPRSAVGGEEEKLVDGEVVSIEKLWIARSRSLSPKMARRVRFDAENWLRDPACGSRVGAGP